MNESVAISNFELFSDSYFNDDNVSSKYKKLKYNNFLIYNLNKFVL